MADKEKGRDKQARGAENQQREHDEARDRFDEAEPPRDVSEKANEARRERKGNEDKFGECHRRSCTKPAEFVVFERYQEETGHGAVEAEVGLCHEHTAEESPTNLDDAYAEYVFRVEPLSERESEDTD